MIRKVILQLTIVLNILLLINCNGHQPKLELDFDSAIGKYKSNYKNGLEMLELRSDSTYIYKLVINQDEKYEDVGRWILSETKNKVTFTDWNNRTFMGYNSKEEYIKLQYEMFGLEINPNEVPKYKFYRMEFLTTIKSLKKVYVLRRSYDFQEEFDFIKQN